MRGSSDTPGTSASGCQALLSATGTASASGFSVVAAGGEGNKDGLYFYGQAGRQANSWGNGTSYQCVVTPVKRGGLLTGAGTPNACDGRLAVGAAFYSMKGPSPLSTP